MLKQFLKMLCLMAKSAYVIYEWLQSDIPFHNEPSGGARDNCAIQFYLKSGKGAAWTDSPCNSARCFTICELE